MLLVYVFSITLGLGMTGMWIALALDEWLRGIIMYFRWRSSGFKREIISFRNKLRITIIKYKVKLFSWTYTLKEGYLVSRVVPNLGLCRSKFLSKEMEC